MPAPMMACSRVWRTPTDRRLFPVLLAFASLFVLAGAAQARTETIRWSQSNMNNVSGWKIYVGTASQDYSASSTR